MNDAVLPPFSRQALILLMSRAKIQPFCFAEGDMTGRVAYIAGPYRADSRRGIWQNIRRAAEAGVVVARKGYAVIVPHCTSHMPELLSNIGD